MRRHSGREHYSSLLIGLTVQYQAAIHRSILSWQRKRILRTLDHGTEVSRMAWDGGDETHGTEQGHMLTVHVRIVTRAI